MVAEQEVLERANWLRQQIHRDADVAAGFYGALASRRYGSMDEFVDDDPEGFCDIVDALRNMVEQIPPGEL